MIWSGRGRLRTTCMLAAALALAWVGTRPLDAAAASVYDGGGSGAIILSAPSGSITLCDTDQQLSITGTAAVVLTLFGNTYAGPVTFSGSLDSCEWGTPLSGQATLNIEGSAAFGELSCSSLTGNGLWVGYEEMVVGGNCSVDGQTGLLNDVFIEGLVVPSGATVSPAGISSVVLASVLAWGPILQD